MEILLLVSLALFTGLLMTRITNIFRLPDVTAYLVVGVLIGPSILGSLGIKYVGFTSFNEVDNLLLLSDIALGFIAFSIGSEFKLKNLKTIGTKAVVIGIFQALTATLFVDVVLIFIHYLIPDIVTVEMAIILGAIATATAPAATIMVVKQYKAKGEVTDLLLPVVALDDAVGLVIFAVSFGIVEAMINGTTNISKLIVGPLLEIVLSLFLGYIVAYILTFLESKYNSNSNRLILIIGSIILTVAITKATFGIGQFEGSFSPLLTCMMCGTVFCNICPLADELMESSNKWSQPIIVLFFVLSGAELDLAVFNNHTVIVVGVVYIITRSLGKYFGAMISAGLVGCSHNVRKYLGITLLPQAGVALGMSAIAARALGNHGLVVRNITLFGVLIYELFGPTLTKIALVKSGDIKELPREKQEKIDLKIRNEKIKMAKKSNRKHLFAIPFFKSMLICYLVLINVFTSFGYVNYQFNPNNQYNPNYQYYPNYQHYPNYQYNPYQQNVNPYLIPSDTYYYILAFDRAATNYYNGQPMVTRVPIIAGNYQYPTQVANGIIHNAYVSISNWCNQNILSRDGIQDYYLNQAAIVSQNPNSLVLNVVCAFKKRGILDGYIEFRVTADIVNNKFTWKRLGINSSDDTKQDHIGSDVEIYEFDSDTGKIIIIR